MIDLSKQYRTAKGCEVKLSHISGIVVYGYFKDEDSTWTPTNWYSTTGFFGYNKGDPRDLVEVKPDKAKLEDRVVEIEFLQWRHHRLGVITLDSENPLVLKAKIKGV